MNSYFCGCNNIKCGGGSYPKINICHYIEEYTVKVWSFCPLGSHFGVKQLYTIIVSSTNDVVLSP